MTCPIILICLKFPVWSRQLLCNSDCLDYTLTGWHLSCAGITVFVNHCDFNFRYGRAAEMYTKVLQLRPRDWRAQLNRGVSLLGAGDYEESKKAFKEAFKMTNRLDIHDAIKHLKQNQKKNPKGLTSVMASAEQSATGRQSNINGMYTGEPANILCLLCAHCLTIVAEYVVKYRE